MIEKIRDVKQKEQTRLRETLMRFYNNDPNGQGPPQNGINPEYSENPADNAKDFTSDLAYASQINAQ